MKESQFVIMMICIIVLGDLFNLIVFAYMLIYGEGFWMWFSLISCFGWLCATLLFSELESFKQELISQEKNE